MPTAEARRPTAYDISHPEDVPSTRANDREATSPAKLLDHSYEKRYVLRSRAAWFARLPRRPLRILEGSRRPGLELTATSPRPQDRGGLARGDAHPRPSQPHGHRHRLGARSASRRAGVTDAATEISGAKFGAFFYNVERDGPASPIMLYTLSGAPREAFEKFGLPRQHAGVRADFPRRGRRPLGRHHPGPALRHDGAPPRHAAGTPAGAQLPGRPGASRSGEVIGGLFFGHPEPGVFTERAERHRGRHRRAGRGRDRQRAPVRGRPARRGGAQRAAREPSAPGAEAERRAR